jgi:hypothetical protein
MRTTSWRVRRLLVAGTVAVALAAGAVPAAAQSIPAVPAAEPGWPLSHQPASDPRPGDPGYLAPRATTVTPPDGWTDAAFKIRDPQGYADMLPQRSKLEAELLAKVHTILAAEGITPGADATATVDTERVDALLAPTVYSPYGYLRFKLVPNTTSPYARNGYLGTLYFIYGIYNPVVDAYKWFTVSWPARSGNNKPADQSKIGIGPIPAYTWDYGFMSKSWRGYESDGRDEFYPGKWRLDPWSGGPYGRSCLEVHGGTKSHEFGATAGCIRIYPAAINSLKTYYDTKMANKKDPACAHLFVSY